MLRKFFHCILLAKSPNNKHSVFEPARCYRVWPSPNPPQNDLFFSIGFSRKCRFLQNWGSSKKSMSPGECSAHLSEDLYFWNISHVRLLPRLIWAEIGFLGFFRNIFPLNEARSSCQEVFFCFCRKWSCFFTIPLCLFVPSSGGSLSRMRQKESLGNGGIPKKSNGICCNSPWQKGDEQKHYAGRNMLKDVISNSDKRTDMETWN